MKIKAAVCRAVGAPLSIEELELDAPKNDEVLVKVVACGVCHTDMAMRDQAYPVPHPIVLGHEGAGIVEAVGKDVTMFKPGDAVLMSFDHCGHCPACHKALPGFCDSFFSYNFAGFRQDGSVALHKGSEAIHSNFFGQSTFASHALATERNLVKVDKNENLEILAPLGCGLQTGAGAVFNALKLGVGETIAVFGIGSVALAAVMAAAASGAATIVAVGRNNEKLKLAKEVGATHTVNSREVKDVVAAIKEVTGGRGTDYSIDTTAQIPIMRQSLECLAPMGKAVVLGAAPPGTDVPVDVQDLMVWGKSFIGVIEGNCVPQDLIPRLIGLYKQGKFPMDKLYTFYPFDKINEAIEDSENGRIIKAILRME